LLQCVLLPSHQGIEEPHHLRQANSY
jgi:hypothetical protein